MENIYEKIKETVASGKHIETKELVKISLADGKNAVDILNFGLVPGVQVLGEKFKNGNAFLPEIFISIRAMNFGLEELKDHLKNSEIRKKATVVLGTVKGDMHDIGKNLVGMMLNGNGYNVVDIGVDATAEKFIKAAQENKADVVAMSGLLTTTIPYFREVIDGLHNSGLKQKVRVIVGGAPVTENYANEIGSDGYAEDCISAVEEVEKLMKM